MKDKDVHYESSVRPGTHLTVGPDEEYPGSVCFQVRHSGFIHKVRLGRDQARDLVGVLSDLVKGSA